MKMQSKTPVREPIIEYRPESRPFNQVRPAPKGPAQTVPVASQSAPKTEKAPGPGPKQKLTGEAFWSQFQGEQLVFQLKSGAIVIGKFEGMQRNWLRIESATIIGKSNRASVPWVIIEINQVAHFHPAGAVEQEVTR